MHITRKIFATQKSKIAIFVIHFFHFWSTLIIGLGERGRARGTSMEMHTCIFTSSCSVQLVNTDMTPPFFACQKLSLQKFSFRKLTLFFPTLGSGRKNKVRPWRIVKASARLSLLKFNRTCVQKSVSGKLVCTFCECCTSVTWATKWSL